MDAGMKTAPVKIVMKVAVFITEGSFADCPFASSSAITLATAIGTPSWTSDRKNMNAGYAVM